MVSVGGGNRMVNQQNFHDVRHINCYYYTYPIDDWDLPPYPMTFTSNCMITHTITNIEGKKVDRITQVFEVNRINIMGVKETQLTREMEGSNPAIGIDYHSYDDRPLKCTVTTEKDKNGIVCKEEER